MLNNCGAGGKPPNTGATMMGVDQGDQKAPKKCLHNGGVVKKERDRSETIKEQEGRLTSAEDKEVTARERIAKAEAALLAPPKGAMKATLRRELQFAQKALPGATAYKADQQRALGAMRWEEKVAQDLGNAKNFLLICKICQDEAGDLDVVTDDKVKEVKSSPAGYDKGKFEKYRAYVEDNKIFDKKVMMKLALPAAMAEEVEKLNPELKGRVQGH